MIVLPGYNLTETLYESDRSLVFRGYRLADNRPVVVKALSARYPAPETIAKFKREYELLQKLRPLEGVIEAYSLEKHDYGLAIILEDFGGLSLARARAGRPLPLGEFLPLAIKIAGSLGQIHRQNVIHKDINPSNIIFNPRSGQVKLIDFGLATVLSREESALRSPETLQGTLAYMSPEQTGRMNRALDYRADFYSLGVTFYELLTGELPFPGSDDAMALVHQHLARHPLPPHQLNPALPPVISDIILKLMAKTAEDRYQSAGGLKADLEICLAHWERGERLEPFTLGRRDAPDRFYLPQKLYGREEALAALLAAFERVSAPPLNGKTGGAEMMLVAGQTGVGKSALIHEIHKPLAQERGYFIAGKFDQFQRNIPYAALIQTFQDLTRQLLTETDAQIATWKEKLLAALGPNGRVIGEVIPEVELIMGPQPSAPELPPAEARNRFNLVFQSFISVFARPEHPLVLFLDDLQWADLASLKLLQLFMSDPDRRCLFLVGAYRDHEVDSTHPLALTLAEIKKAGGSSLRLSSLP